MADNDTQPANQDSPIHDVNSDDLMPEFVRNPRELMPGLQEDNPSTVANQPKGTRRRERLKKLSTRFNENAGYLPQPK